MSLGFARDPSVPLGLTRSLYHMVAIGSIRRNLVSHGLTVLLDDMTPFLSSPELTPAPNPRITFEILSDTLKSQIHSENPKLDPRVIKTRSSEEPESIIVR